MYDLMASNSFVNPSNLEANPAALELEPFHHDVRALFTHEALSPPAPSYLVVCDLATSPTPDRFKAGEEVGVLL